ncbi:MAG TPA: peptide chain release factor 1 [Saprospiraceae bacterium]|nr:peptide chain release factor 1 [Saprospiraceae bacterium]HMX87295.1 peptide chain release factor 1 [Saprospiraceae bacterium]HMZ39122.1 peptide chain release factor 1 [Saprospiraceae bacterium]HNA63295.1 peptide chain release factor 1 [Saprospiraceae bacterium]HNC37448.1 peptide chain release factor 1 [Saprospiraceae bacterium]
MDLIKKLEAVYERYQFLEERLANPEVLSNLDEYKKVSREYKELEPVVSSYVEYKKLQASLDSTREMLDSGDDEMKAFAEVEVKQVEEALLSLEEKLKIDLIPKDPEDSKDVIFEIRAGTGGDEASLFAGDLFRMYTRYFDMQGWKYEVLTESEGSVGGYSKIVMDVNGTDVYGKLKFESGAHRVQRVPDTEASGRIHTSAATVAVIPKMEVEDIDINKADLRVDTFRSSGAGGQHVNKTESGVRFTHLPTGIVAESTDSRSQHKNREIAMGRLVQKIRDSQVAQFESSMAAQRKSLVGTGDRSDKIRTYNFPQNRMTDHRINFTSYNLGDIMNGHIDDIIEALRVAENIERMKGEE